MRYPAITEERLRNALSRIARLVYPRSVKVEVAVWHVQGEPVAPARAFRAKYTPCETGVAWGAPWETSWFRVRGTVPADWRGQRAVARLRLTRGGAEGFTAEGLVYRDGLPVIAINVHRDEVEIAAKARGGERFEFFVEAAANISAPARHLANSAPGKGEPAFRLEQADLAQFDAAAFGLYHDYRVLLEALEVLPERSQRRAEIREALNRALNLLEDSDPATFRTARAALATALAKRNGDTRHVVTGVGHAHIDTAWLWPLRESIRKCARTFSTALDYMARYPDYVFVCSQAQQYAWMKALYPSIWQGIRKAVKRGQWEPVGSMWVETDCNLVGGESLIRQIFYGKKFFQEEFGIETRDVWLPDVFGYAATMPQIMAGSGVEFFLTQKISWSQFNKFPHHTFWWEGLDGTRIFTHFPPADTYNAVLGPRDLAKTVGNFIEHGRSSRSMLVYGYGDGGGGPSIPMLEAASRLADFDGLPRLELGKAAEFFEKARAEAGELATWVGELYLELHRGTYTTQAANKRSNRKCEMLLLDAEFLDAAHAALTPRRNESVPQPARAIHDVGAMNHPRPASHAAALERAWKLLLLNQFHDIIPGSSIAWVYQDSARDYATLTELASAVRDASLAGMAERIDTSGFAKPVLIVNTLGFRRKEVVELPSGKLAEVDLPPCGYVVVDADLEHGPASAVRAAESRQGFTLENGLLRVVVNRRGQLASVQDLRARREVLAEGECGNTFVLYEDIPNNYDAWDIDIFHAEKARAVPAAEVVELVENRLLRAAVGLVFRFGSSRIEQRIVLRAGSPRVDFETSVEWREEQKLLKVGFPVAVRSSRATYEIAYGHVERPTHENTSWDLARFEVCAHRWADLSETGYGVALLNDCKYGHRILGNVMQLSLLRSPLAPDPSADRGHHVFTHSLLPHAGDLRDGRVIEEAAALNRPPRVLPLKKHAGDLPPAHSFLAVDNPSASIECVKRADDGDGFIVRLREAHGSTVQAALKIALPFRKAFACDLLERNQRAVTARGGTLRIGLKPFEIASFRLTA